MSIEPRQEEFVIIDSLSLDEVMLMRDWDCVETNLVVLIEVVDVVVFEIEFVFVGRHNDD